MHVVVPRRALTIHHIPRALAVSALLALCACSSDTKTSASTSAVSSSSAPTTVATSAASTSTTTTTTTSTTTTTTAAVKGFAQHFATELTLPDASTVKIVGDISLSSGVVAAETGIVGTSHLVMFPKITATFTNTTAGASVTLKNARIEMFLDQSIAHDCVVNIADSRCDEAIIFGGAPNGSPLTLVEGGTFDVVDDGNVRIIDVPDETADQLVHTVFDGTIVTGYAVVITGATADSVATTIFNREGKPVVTCPSLPANCMDATRSVLA